MLIPRLNINFSLKQQFLFLFGSAYKNYSNEYLLNHCRSGLVLALKSLGLPKNSGVGVMAYNCHTVFSSIVQAGYRPVFIDVTKDFVIDLNDLSKKKHLLSALIVTHLFGIQNNIGDVRHVVSDVPLIEDCAHAYGISNLYGDFACFSIGQGKYPSIGDGGLLILNNLQYKESLDVLYKNVPSYSIIDNLFLYCKLLLMSFLYNPYVYEMMTVYLKKKSKGNDRYGDVTIKKMSYRISAIYNNFVNVNQDNINNRLKIAEGRAEMIKSLDGVKDVLYGLNAFMLIAKCSKPDDVQKKLRKSQIDSATHFKNAIKWASNFGYKHGDCPVAEKINKYYLMIPVF